MTLQWGPASFLTVAEGPTARIRWPSMAIAAASGKAGFSVQILPFSAGEHPAMVGPFTDDGRFFTLVESIGIVAPGGQSESGARSGPGAHSRVRVLDGGA